MFKIGRTLFSLLVLFLVTDGRLETLFLVSLFVYCSIISWSDSAVMLRDAQSNT